MRKFSFLVLVLSAGFGTARAGFTVNPIYLHLSASQQTTSVKITNTGKQATVVQAVLKAWSQKNSEDVYSDTKALLATPPIFDMAPEDGQVVRVGLLTSPGRNTETAYRLFLTEVPPAPRPGLRGLSVALRISIPVFVAPLNGKASPQLVWNVRRMGADKLQVLVANNGTGHEQISKLTLASSGQGAPLVHIKTGNGYLLAHTNHAWEVNLGRPVKQGQALFVRGKTTQGAFQVRLNWVH